MCGVYGGVGSMVGVGVRALDLCLIDLSSL